MEYLRSKIERIDEYLNKNFEQQKINQALEQEFRSKANVAIGQSINTPPTVKSITEGVVILTGIVGSIALFTKLCVDYDIRF